MSRRSMAEILSCTTHSMRSVEPTRRGRPHSYPWERLKSYTARYPSEAPSTLFALNAPLPSPKAGLKPHARTISKFDVRLGPSCTEPSASVTQRRMHPFERAVMLPNLFKVALASAMVMMSCLMKMVFVASARSVSGCWKAYSNGSCRSIRQHNVRSCAEGEVGRLRDDRYLKARSSVGSSIAQPK